MPKINVVHVIGGGILAGLIINVFGMVTWVMILANDFQRQIGKEPPSSANMVFWFWGFLLGIIAVWLYASIRAHYGPGAKTAIMAGSMTWLLSVFMPNCAVWALGIFGGSLVAKASALGLVELILATLAGAWIYKPAR